jgi:hypothetical protein
MIIIHLFFSGIYKMEILSYKSREIVLGEFIDTKIIINQDMKLYDENGSLVFCFIKKIIPEEFYDFDEKIVKMSKMESANRGNAAGKVTIEGLQKGKEHWKRFPATLCNVKGEVSDKGTSSSFFKYHDGTISKRARSNTVQSMALGGFDKSPQHPCRLTFYTKKILKEYPSIFPLCSYISNIYEERFPEYYHKQKEVYDNSPKDYVIPDTIFSTITLNHDFRTAPHLDKGDCKQGLTCFTIKKCGDYKGGEICFPEYQMGCNVEQGDLLIFDPHIAHCNNELEGEGRMSLVFYLREKMNKCPI